MTIEQPAPLRATHGRITLTRRLAGIALPQFGAQVGSDPRNPATARYSERALRTLVDVVAVWRDALSTFCAQSLPILTVALAGFWGITLIGALVGMMLQMDFDGRASTLLDRLGDEHRLRALLAMHKSNLNQVALVQAVAAMLAFSFARGVITWLALHGPQPGDEPERCGSIGQAMRMTLQRYPTLLTGSALYGALVTAGILGLSELIRPLEYTDGKLAHVWAEPA